MKKIFASLDKECAKQLSQHLLSAADSLNISAKIVRESCSETEFKSYRTEMAYVISDIGDIMEGIYALHPDLRPYTLNTGGAN